MHTIKLSAGTKLNDPSTAELMTEGRDTDARASALSLRISSTHFIAVTCSIGTNGIVNPAIALIIEDHGFFLFSSPNPSLYLSPAHENKKEKKGETGV